MNRPLIAASSHRMGQGLIEDHKFSHKLEQDYIRDLPNRNLAALKKFKSSLSNHLIDRLDHSLQKAKQAERDGANIELIVAALIPHDGNALAQENHSQVSVTIIRPFFRD